MIKVDDFYSLLLENDISFFAGVPDSLLKDFCAYITDNSKNHIISANEGGAVALATGHYLATGKPGLVYMQNSGQGNAVNPLLSLADPEIFSIPMILLVGLRGEVGVHDEPQHIKQGRITDKIFDTMEIPNCILDEDFEQARKQTKEMIELAKTESRPVAIIVKKGLFEQYNLKKTYKSEALITRESAIETVIENISDDYSVVSTTGMISRELYEIREKRNEDHSKDLLTVGSMGHASQIALGIALSSNHKKVVCLDGDGAVIMHMGGLSSVGQQKPKNMLHIVLNNEVHDSVGGQPTAGDILDFSTIALSCGYSSALVLNTCDEIKEFFKDLNLNKISLPCFVEIKVLPGSREDLGRPKQSLSDMKKAFMGFLSE